MSCKKLEHSISKKDLTEPLPKRQPTPDEMDAFVRVGAGKDTEKQYSVQVETAHVTVDLPRDMHRRFKIACAVIKKEGTGA